MNRARSIINNVYDLLIEDENLLRLLYYPPQITMNDPSPLDDELENLSDSKNRRYWDIVDNHILLTSKSDDLEENSLCRIYVYSGKKRASNRNFKGSKQEIIVDVFVHFEYELEQRLEWITEILSDILMEKRVEGGLGVIDYRNGYNFNAPKGYQAYRHIFEIGGTK